MIGPDATRPSSTTRVAAVAAVAVTVAGLVVHTLQADWRLLLWAEVAVVPLAAVAVVTAVRGRGGATVATGVVAVAAHAETWLASLQGTIEGDLLSGDTTDVLRWPFDGRNGAASLIVLGGVAAVVAGVRLATDRARNPVEPPRVPAGRSVASPRTAPVTTDRSGRAPATNAEHANNREDLP